MKPGELTAWVTAIATLMTVLGNMVLQIIQAMKSTQNGKKIEENTALTKAAAQKIDDIHAVTDVIKATTGSIDVSKLRANQPDKGA